MIVPTARGWLAAILCGAAVAGCAPDPASGLLAPGSEAMVFDGMGGPPGPRVAIERDDKRGLLAGLDMLEGGTRVRVAGDPGPAEDASRSVAVRILEGEKKDVTASLQRRNLRPLPR